MTTKNNRRLKIAKTLVQNHTPAKVSRFSKFTSMPAVQFIASGVAAYGLIKLAIKSAKSLIEAEISHA